MKTSLSIEEIHSHLLEIATEMHKICVKHNITYFLAYGTLLGAVRHKGFIPWDDDMDIFVPIEDYDRFVNTLTEELPPYIRCCSYKNHPGVIQPYVKISDMRTAVDDKCVWNLKEEDKLGVNIDVFPLAECDDNDIHIKKIFKLRKIYQYVYTESTTGSYLKHILKKIIRFFYPIKKERMLDMMIENMLKVKKGDMLTCPIVNNYGYKFWPKSYFGKPRETIFNNTKLFIPEKSEELLANIYGDYMRLPPENKRKTHLTNTYLRK